VKPQNVVCVPVARGQDNLYPFNRTSMLKAQRPCVGRNQALSCPVLRSGLPIKAPR
jgi:hypothetical protein